MFVGHRCSSALSTVMRRSNALSVISSLRYYTRSATLFSRPTLAGLPARRVTMKPQAGDPFFREIWRKFQLRVHPDLFTDYPVLQAANSASLQKLQGILNEAKTAERASAEALRPRTEMLEFYLRDTRATLPNGAPPAFLRVPLVVRVAGANCAHLLADSLASLFKIAGLPNRFHWGAEFWGSTFKANEPLTKEEEEAAAAEGR